MFLLHPHTCALPPRAHPHPLASRHTKKKPRLEKPQPGGEGNVHLSQCWILGRPSHMGGLQIASWREELWNTLYWRCRFFSLLVLFN